MNKYYLFGALALGVTALASCSQEENPVINSGEGLNFSVKLPTEQVSRAFSDGNTATELDIVVYNSATNEVLVSNIAGSEKNAELINIENYTAGTADTNPTWNVSVQLAKDVKYKVFFWAHSPEAPYTYYPESGEMKVSYESAELNDESRDAFMVLEDDIVSDGSTTSVTLKRPFAQVNVGTNDITIAENTGLTIANTGLTFTTLGTEFNVLENNAVTALSEDAVTFAATGKPSETFPVEEYEYLAMAYVLAPSTEIAKSATINTVTLTINSNTDFSEFDNIPVQGNYRTNIYGSLLTDKSSFIVEIEKNYIDDFDVMIPSWSGESKTPVINETAKTVSISTPEELAGLAGLVNDGQTFEGYTVTLKSDINLAGKSWTPIGYLSPGSTGDAGTTRFAGTFDGGGHTISNLKVVSTGDMASAGLFGRLNGNVKNLTLKNVDVTSDHYAGALAGYAYINTWGTDCARIAIENCSVIGGTIISTPILVGTDKWDNGDKAGGLIGYVGEGNITITGNSVSDLTITAYRDLGGVIGAIQNDGPHGTGNVAMVVDDNSATNVKIIQDMAHNYKNYKPGERVGEIYGFIASDKDTFTGTATNVTITTINAPAVSE